MPGKTGVRESEVLTQTVGAYNSLPYPIVTMGQGFRVVNGNKAAFEFLNCGDLHGLRLRLDALISKELREQLITEVERGRVASKPHLVQYAHTNGHQRLFSISAVPLLHAQAYEWALILSNGLASDNQQANALATQAIREEIRTSLARDVHDNLGQEITVLRLAVGRFQRELSTLQLSSELQAQFSFLVGQIDKVGHATRRIAYELRQDLVATKGLAFAAGQLVSTIQERTSIQGKIEVGSGWVEPNSGMEKHIYRSLQELLNNMVKHARATRFKVRLYWAAGTYCLEVSDDGVGVALERLSNLSGTHVGIRSLHERALIYGGTITLRSRPEVDGFQVIMALPERRAQA